ncbi:Putative 3-oxopropanoate dehydrogenase [Geodia barretti]|uniref:3-oxopropanoate dehydrogenase n=1 Tax=Geodia barretti TaxID=519541 RepID=A0AA35QTR3_GEOBA|nr:Putative 3-oxopropanoate dehydrogenase [Geodia barretti]
MSAAGASPTRRSRSTSATTISRRIRRSPPSCSTNRRESGDHDDCNAHSLDQRCRPSRRVCALRRCLQPGCRRGDRARALRRGVRGRQCRARRGGGAARLGRHAAVAQGAGHLRLQGAGRKPQGRAGQGGDAGARQGAVGRDRLGEPRARGAGVRLRHPAPAAGRLHRGGGHWRRQFLDPCAARRGRRHYALQLPPWCRCGCSRWPSPAAMQFILKPSEKDPSASMMLAEWLKEAGLPDGVFSVVHGDKEAVDAILTHPDIAAVSFVGSTPIAEYVYQTGCAHGKRVQALGGAKNHAVVMPDADLTMASDALIGRGLRLRRRALHGRLGRGRDRRQGGRRADRGPEAQDRQHQGRARDRRRGRHGAAGDEGALRQGPQLCRHRRRGRRRAGGGRPRPRPPGLRERLFHRPLPLRPGHARHAHLQGGDLRAGALGGPRARLRCRASDGERARVRQRGGDLHPRRRRRARVREPGRDRHGGRQRADPRAGRLSQLRRLEALALRRPRHARHGGRALLHQAQDRDLALADRHPLGRRPLLPHDVVARRPEAGCRER